MSDKVTKQNIEKEINNYRKQHALQQNTVHIYETTCECIFLPHNIYSYQKEYYNNKHSTVQILCNYSSLSILCFPY